MISILLHGFSGDRRAWDEVSLHWQPEKPGVARRVAIDLPGHGAGPAVRVGWRANLEAVREAIEAATSSLDGGEVGGERLRDATVVGYSLGARVALGLVAEGLAGRAVLIGVNPGLATAEEREARRSGDAQWGRLLRAGGLERFVERWAAQPLFASQAQLSPERKARRQAMRCAQSAEGLARSLEEMGLAEMPDYRAAIAARADRLTLVVGEGDSKFRGLAEALVAAVPALPLHVIAGAGHDVPLEQPRALGELLGRLVG